MTVLSEEAVADARARLGSRSAREIAAVVALTVMLFMVTKGPIFRIRQEAAPIAGDFIDDVWVQAAFVAIYALVLGAAVPAARLVVRDRVVTAAFGAFVIALLASSIWSVAVPRTVQQSSMLLLGTAAALVVGAYVRRFDALLALWVALHAGIAASVFAWARDWPLARVIGFYGDAGLAGLYYNTNSLGPVAILGAASSVSIAVEFRRRMLSPIAAPLVLVVVAAGDILVWLETNSRTPVVATVGAALAVIAFAACIPGPFAAVWRGLVALGSVAVCALAVVQFVRRPFSTPFGLRSTLDVRTPIWEVAFGIAAERPAHGWGFMAAWQQPRIYDELAERQVTGISEAHSGYIEVFLGAGLIGLVLLMGVLAVALVRTGTVLWWRPSPLAAWSFALVVYAMVVNVAETNVGANLLPWTLLCLATGQAIRAAAASRDDDATADEVEGSCAESDETDEIDRDITDEIELVVVAPLGRTDRPS